MTVQEQTSKQQAAAEEARGRFDVEIMVRTARLEERLSAVDSRLDTMERDLRDLGKKLDAHFYWMLAAIVGLAGLMAKGFHWF